MVRCLTLVDYRDRPLQIKQIITSRLDLHVRVTEEPSAYLPGWRYGLEASLADTANLPPGHHTASITIQTTDPEREAIVVRALIHRVRRIRMAPETLSLKVDPGTSGKQVGKIFLDDTVGEPLEVESVTTSHECLSCKAVLGESRQRLLLNVNLDESKLPATHPPLKVRIALRKPIAEELWAEVIPCSRSASVSRP